ncbi:tRNA threonylcarbamoyladenosine dehydratase [Pelomonas sp. CA6]|uniref:tRNA threonylcarbamoyladenosine dehydratase n=1 Tax=Pelomonas sp. CA6 TaxID=2907999 RepID=UPI001F4B7C4B|nr:tRNA threonylcarbamoyladenosine dehydratase [Pelomonas sp. CA6]MCH7342406.1 tRNA threonylcarbamoyladenosine dehydratase [Pelomonas sp. CA6]
MNTALERTAGLAPTSDEADLERRFGGLRRLYGGAAYERLRAARFAVVGLGGVGSWTVEALARMGVARLVLIDMDHVAESNINRQVQALTSTLGMAKAEALRRRVLEIHPGCEVLTVEEFVEPDNWPALLGDTAIDGLVDACDQVRAKAALAAWALARRPSFVCVGAAGGKQRPQAVELDDLAATTHDPLLASLRQRLRKFHGAARAGRIGLGCVFSRESVQRPAESCELDGSLNCHGYGSSVAVTAAFGMCAAAELVRQHLARATA